MKMSTKNKPFLPVGDKSCHGAIFVYKSDDTAGPAWEHVKKLAADHTLRAELHQTKSALVQAISAWSARVDATAAMVMIYAHMGPRGMVPRTGAGTERVYWGELAKALGAGVHTLWLIGCHSELSTKVWSPLTAPVRGYLLATMDSAPFRPFLPVFANEVSMDMITPFDEMLSRIVAEDPKLGKLVAYYYPTATGWVKGIRPNNRAGYNSARADERAALTNTAQAVAEQLRTAVTRDDQRRALTNFVDLLSRQQDEDFMTDFYDSLAKTLDKK